MFFIVFHLDDPRGITGHILAAAILLPDRFERQCLRFLQERKSRGEVAVLLGLAREVVLR